MGCLGKYYIIIIIIIASYLRFLIWIFGNIKYYFIAFSMHLQYLLYQYVLHFVLLELKGFWMFMSWYSLTFTLWNCRKFHLIKVYKTQFKSSGNYSYSWALTSSTISPLLVGRYAPWSDSIINSCAVVVLSAVIQEGENATSTICCFHFAASYKQ